MLFSITRYLCGMAKCFGSAEGQSESNLPSALPYAFLAQEPDECSLWSATTGMLRTIIDELAVPATPMCCRQDH